MDCPSEEQMIRMKLANLENIHSLDFDIPERKLVVYHNGQYEPILQQLDMLKFDTSLVESVTLANPEVTNGKNELERKLLWQVLGINFFFFVLEMLTGFLSKSMGLVADSLDMLADSFVYGLALLAVGGSLAFKKNIAKTAGIFQFVLALLGFAEVIRRFAGFESVPSFQLMIVVSLLALAGNWLSLYLLQKSKSKDAHMQAGMIFTSNDIMVNMGVMVAGGLVYLTHSVYPDLVIGTIIFVIVVRGAVKIFKLA